MPARLAAGELDKLIEIIPVTEVQDAAGEPIAADGHENEVWAKLIEQRVSERFSGASDQVAADLIFRIRTRDVDQTSIVAFGGDRHEIVGIALYGRVGLDLACKRLGRNV